MNTYPGERLGLPESGSRSIARPGRRIGALVIDYVAATIIATGFLGYDQFALPTEAGLTQFAPMLVFAVLQILFIPTAGGSPGHRILGMRLVRLDGSWIGLWRPIVRTLLLVVVVPAVIWDTDQRGLHDKVVGTVLIRT
ncbi:RDD family protein [Microbacterium sp. MYb54]|nr:RDD family protein [Microbacterium sp. MYb43]PQZ82139.1 RDD family protein [Microbacterium sp. MYb40]PRB22931.1 RDD family protein [Microbacterium sp. MYb50]PRB24160.1 RDD family protein [Microbacterium sp. MYb54]PRB69644.1 RDD family protein [Microbacterium sp. MYb24]PRB79047.1 RDD family protein [Microbacterium sp. MYb32]